MKLVTLLLVTWLALASCRLSFLGKFEQPEDAGKNKDNFITFLEGVFSYFNLPSPSQIEKCFCEVNSGMYFNLLQEIGEILKDTKDRSSLELHLEYGKILILLHSLKDTHACMFLTQDFTDLLNALDIGERNPSVFANYAYIFYQAHYIDLFEGFKPVLSNLNTQSNTEAGRAFGAVLKNTVASIKEEGLGHIVFTAFGNGGAIALDIDEPDDSLQCYDNDASGLLMEFIYKLCDAVANGDWREGACNEVYARGREGYYFKDSTGRL